MQIHKEYKISDTRVLRIYPDSDPENPRTHWDGNITKMICAHKRYTLGDEHNFDHDNYASWEEFKLAIEEELNPLLILPLYMYDHSGQTISLTPFGDQWDSGQIGWVVITKERLKELGIKGPYTVKKLFNIAKEEVKIYDQWMTGDVYGYKLIEFETCGACNHTDEKVVDDCWGFYGDNILENGILDSLPEENRAILKKQLEEKKVA